MKQSKIVRAISVFMTCLLAGCASYTPTIARLDPSGPNVGKAAYGDLMVYIEEYATPEKSEVAFDTDMADEGVLPLLIRVDNNGKDPWEVKAADILVRGDTELKALGPAEAADKASRGAVGRAIGWSLIVPIIGIPVAVVASAAHTKKVNKQMVYDFSNRMFEDGAILLNQHRSGFLFFELEEGRKDLAGLRLELTAKNAITGEVVTIAAPLPAATFTGEAEVSEKKEEDEIAAATPEETKTAYVPTPEAWARSAKQAAAKSGHWLLGKWVGTRQSTWGTGDITIRITSYDQATHAFKGDGYLELRDAYKWSTPPSDLVITAVIDEKGRVVMTTDYSGGWSGRSFTFNLKREEDGYLSGTTSYGPPSLSLKKKQ